MDNVDARGFSAWWRSKPVWVRYLGVGLAYAALYLGLTLASVALNLAPGIGVGYPVVGLSLALLVLFGLRMVPWVLLAGVVQVLFLQLENSPPLPGVAMVLCSAMAYSLAASRIRRVLFTEQPTSWVRALGRAAPIVAGAALLSAVGTVGVRAAWALAGLHQSNYWVMAFHRWVGDLAAVAMLTPFLTVRMSSMVLSDVRQLRLPSLWRSSPLATLPRLLRFAPQMALLVLLLGLAFGPWSFANVEFSLLLFIPLITMTLSTGMLGVTAGALTIMLLVPAILLYFGMPLDRGIEVWTLTLAWSGTGLALNALLTDHDTVGAGLRDDRARYRMLFESAGDFVLVHELGEDGVPGCFQEFNQVVVDRLGYTAAELHALRPADIVALEVPEQGLGPRARAEMGRRGQLLFQKDFVTKQGDRIPVEMLIRGFEYQGRKMAITIGRDITRRREAEQLLARQQAFERLLSDLAMSFLGVPSASLDAGIEGALEQVGRFLELDRVSLSRLSADGEVLEHVYRWSHDPGKQALLRCRVDECPWLSSSFTTGEAVVWRASEGLPAGATPTERGYLGEAGLLSYAVIPIMAGGEVLACLGFTNTSTPGLFTPELVERFHLLARIVAGVFERRRAEMALERSAKIVAATTDAVVATDVNGVITSWNRGAESIFGYRREDALGKPIRMLYRPSSWHILDGMTGDLLAGKTIPELETTVVNGAGEDVQILLALTTIHDIDGRVTEMVGISKDITERKLADERREEDRAFLDSIYNNAEVVMFVVAVDAAGGFRYISLSRAFERMTGLPLTTMVGRTPQACADILPQPQIDRLLENYARCADQATVLSYDEALSFGGKDMWWHTTLTPVQDAQGRVFRIIGSAINTSDRVMAELERAQLSTQVQGQSRRLEQILASVPTGVLVLGAQGRVLRANPTGGRDLMALAGAKVGDFIDRLGDRALEQLLGAPPAKGLWHEISVGTRTFEAIARPLVGDADQAQWVLLLNDVTHERSARLQLQQQERLAAVGQLAAGIAHDFNNIIATIVLYAQMTARSASLSDRDRERLGVINKQAWHATRLIDQILDFSRRSVLELRPLDLVPLLKEQAQLLERTLPESIRVRLDCAMAECVINADPTRMQQMVTNLAVNARDAMPSGGELRMALSRLPARDMTRTSVAGIDDGDWMRLEVADTGCGIAPEVLPHLFEPFFTTKGAGKGNGLGLAQVHGIVGQHGGHITVTDNAPQGTRFTIYLPVASITKGHEEVMAASQMVGGHRETILVVEDALPMREALADMLASLNYRVLAAENGRAALEVLTETGGVDLVLTDLVMPEMGGGELLQEMWAREIVLPVVVLSGHPLEQRLDELRGLGMTAWMQKPPQVEKLAQMLREALA